MTRALTDNISLFKEIIIYVSTSFNGNLSRRDRVLLHFTFSDFRKDRKKRSVKGQQRRTDMYEIEFTPHFAKELLTIPVIPLRLLPPD